MNIDIWKISKNYTRRRTERNKGQRQQYHHQRFNIMKYYSTPSQKYDLSIQSYVWV